MKPNHKSSAVDADAEQHYSEKIQWLQTKISDQLTRSRRLSWIRGALVLPAVLIALLTWLDDTSTTAGYYLAGALMIAFTVVAGIHEQVISTLESLQARKRIYELHQYRLRRDFQQLPAAPKVEVASRETAIVRDLDILGQASLFQWICLAQTPGGCQKLFDWLLNPASPETLRARQQTVRRLAELPELREELQLRGRLLACSPHGTKGFIDWCEGSAWLRRRPWLRWTARSLTAAMFLLVGLATYGVSTPVLLAIGCVLVANALLNFLALPPVQHVFETVASKQGEVQHYRVLFQLIRDAPRDDALLQRLRHRLGENGQQPVHRLDDLHRRVQLAAARHSPVWGLPYLGLQYFFLCDFHILDYLEGWQTEYGDRANDWFDVLAEFEALLCLANVAFDHPRWAFPDVSSRHRQVTVKAVGHPLLKDSVRVTNDVTIGPTGHFLLVTGSNMSGKSTLLRSVGLNTLLAQAGAPTCSTDFTLPPLRVATSMRVDDSLADGVSFYLAELKRLKQVVDQADQLAKRSDLGLLFLLDEILLGTNSAERHIAVVRVVRHLLDAGALGAISTHDLELAQSPQLAEACQPVHFRENIATHDGREQMTFDYQLRTGVAPTTNALKLLAMVGLDDTVRASTPSTED